MKKRPVFYVLVSLLILVSVITLIICFITFLNHGVTPVPKSLAHVGGKVFDLKLNEIGDAIGGMSAPVIGILTTILIFYSFQEQYRANTLLVDANKEDDIKDNLKEYLERIEFKFSKLPDGSKLDSINSYKLCIEWHNKIIKNKKKLANETGIDMAYKHPALKLEIEANLLHLSDQSRIINYVYSLVKANEFYGKYFDKLIKMDIADDIIDITEFYFSEFVEFTIYELDRHLTIFDINSDMARHGTPNSEYYTLIRTRASLDRTYHYIDNVDKFLNQYHERENIADHLPLLDRLKRKVRQANKIKRFPWHRGSNPKPPDEV